MIDQSHYLKPIKKLYFLIFLLIGSSVFGQNKVDSLQNLLVSSGDSLKVEILNELSKSLNHTDPKQSLKYAIEAKQLAKGLDDIALIGKSINYIGVSYYYLNELDLSNESYFEALNIFDSVGYKPGVAKVLNNIAWNYKIQGLAKEAIEYFSQSLELALEIGDADLQQGILNNLGTVYRGLGNHEQALEIYQQSLVINRKIGNRQWEAYNLSNIGLIYLDTMQTDKALDYFNQAKNINEEDNYTRELVRNYLNIGGTFIKRKEFQTADGYLQKADSIINVYDYKRENFILYGYKVELSEAKGDFEEALEFYIKYNGLNLELNRLAWNEKVSELQAKYDIAETGRELEGSIQKVKEQRLVIIGGTSHFLLLLGVLFLVLKLYKSKNMWARSVDSLNNEVNQKNEELQTVNEEIQSINDKLEVSVQDRTRRIKTQNEKLVKYAFINSHEVRGPLARVLGLLYLLGLENKSLRNEESFKLLSGATKELDDVIGDASKLLEDEDLIVENKEINN